MTKPTFRSVLIRSMDDIPDWVDRAEFDEDQFENGYACIAVDNDGRIRLHGDCGEPEDNMYLRDWAWVAPALDAAYAAGKADGLREAAKSALGRQQRCAMAEHVLHGLVGEAGLEHLLPLFAEAEERCALDLGRLAVVMPTVRRMARDTP